MLYNLIVYIGRSYEAFKLNFEGKLGFEKLEKFCVQADKIIEKCFLCDGC